MKTPKRHIELTTFLLDGTERVWDYTQEQVSNQRWKRKNRTKQLKRTIARLTKEIAGANRLNADLLARNLAMTLNKPPYVASGSLLETQNVMGIFYRVSFRDDTTSAAFYYPVATLNNKTSNT